MSSRADALSISCSSEKAKSIPALDPLPLLSALGEAEDSLGDDVPKDLGGPGLDGIPAAPKLCGLPAAVRHRSIGPRRQHGERSLDLERGPGEPLVRLRPEQLGHR